jgi:hypothetical protein
MASDNTLVHGDQSLLDSLERLERTPEGCRAAYLALSGLRSHNREWIRLRLAAHLFEPLVTGYGCEVYILSNGDLVVVGRNVPETALEKHAERVRALFRADPATRSDPDTGTDSFYTHYELEARVRDLRLRVETIRRDRGEPWRIISRTQPAQEPGALAPRPLLHTNEALDKLDPRTLIRRQAMVHIDPDRRGRIVCEEFYIALEEVRRHCAPNLDLRSNRWLFQEICRQLDPRTITALGNLDALPGPDTQIALNLTLETILSPALARLFQALPEGTRLVVEVSVIDAVTNLDLLPRAAERLRAHGHALALDGVDPRALAMIDPARLPVDFLKLAWTEDLASASIPWDGPHPERFIDVLGRDHVVLCHAQTEKALLWGLRNGIRLFQGIFIDQIIGATTMVSCPRHRECTLMQCVQRRRAAAGPIRATCPSPRNLTLVTELRALGRRQVGKAEEPRAKGGARG